MPVDVRELHLERVQAAQHGKADASRGDGAHGHALEVVGARDAVGDVPAAGDDGLVGGDVVADQPEDHHHHVLGHGDGVAEGHLVGRGASKRASEWGNNK